ncbi:MAG: hypothetical protein IPN74_10390 [Haliscomenobacter sp.]|nr:hypothetical protein [Haliscomenobacter sp.]
MGPISSIRSIVDADGVLDPIDFTGKPAGVYAVTVRSVTDNWVEGNPGSGGCVDDTDRSVTFTIHEKPKFRQGGLDYSVYTCTEVSLKLSDNLEASFTCDEITKWSWVTTGNPNVTGYPTSSGEFSSPFLNLTPTNNSSVPQVLVYTVTAETEYGCKNTFEVEITVRPKEKFDCVGCGSKINVTLDGSTCSAEITLDQVLLNVAACAAAKDIPASLIYEALEVVVDDGVGADNIVTCPGQHKYVVRLKPGYENCLIWQPCWGVVNAEDKSAPLYTSWIGKCNVGTLAVPGQTELLNGQFTNSTAAFLCLNAEELFNKEQTWKDATSALFAGRPVFADACHNNCSSASRR